MKNSKLSLGLVIAAIVMVTGSSFADGGGLTHPAPDGGSSALLITISLSALALGKKLLR